MRSPRVYEDITHFLFLKIFSKCKNTITSPFYLFTFDTFCFTFDSIIYLCIIHLYTGFGYIFTITNRYPSHNSSGISVQLVVKLVIVISAIGFCV